MRERQYLQCLHHGQLFDLKRGFDDTQDGATMKVEDPFALLSEPLNQSIPIVLPIDDTQKAKIMGNGQMVNCVRLTHNGQLVAVLKEPEVFSHRKEERIHRQFGFSDSRHPAIKMISESGDWLLGGDLEVFLSLVHNRVVQRLRWWSTEFALMTVSTCIVRRQRSCASALRMPIATRCSPSSCATRFTTDMHC